MKFVIDTDMSGDANHPGALALLHAQANLHECELVATATNR